MKTIDGLMLKEMFLSGAANINANRESVDALNVFPVPDGDTGTNMCQTMNSARLCQGPGRRGGNGRLSVRQGAALGRGDGL